MALVRFVQIADLHLGAPFAWLPPARRAERRREQRRALEDVVALAIDRQAMAILVPGDLFDVEGVDAETLAFAVHAFDAPRCPPVFIAPGNHDPATSTSLTWNPRLLSARGYAWPSHVHIFRRPSWTALEIPGTNVTVWGRCFMSSDPVFERPLEPAALAPVAPLDPSRLHVAVFHGSREGVLPTGQKLTAPFSDAEVLAAPFAYLAVGHYHEASALSGPNGVPRLAYTGSTLALHFGESGAHGALVVTIDPDAGPSVQLEPVELDARRVRVVDVDVTGAASADEVERRALGAIDAAGISDRDLVRARLVGRIVHGVRLAPGMEPPGRVFALRWDPRAVRPDYDLEGIRAREPTTTEDRLVQALMNDLDHEPDAERKALLLAALYYGLDALRLREVAPAYEELAP